jgi:hypothetical protein
MNEFISGAIMITFATTGYFFWCFWRKSHDRLYALFAAAFWIMALNRLMVPSGLTGDTEGLPVYYIVRLASFVLILIAIVDKNYSK